MTIMTQRGQDRLSFPSRGHLEEFLPTHRREIDVYVALLSRWGIDPESDSIYSKPMLRLDEVRPEVVRDLDELARRAQALAGPPEGPG